jgi:hypothetical protein
MIGCGVELVIPVGALEGHCVIFGHQFRVRIEARVGHLGGFAACQSEPG